MNGAIVHALLRTAVERRADEEELRRDALFVPRLPREAVTD